MTSARESFGKQLPPQPGPGTEELAADPSVGSDAVDHGGDVGADRFAHRGDRVDEGDLHRQEAVGRVLDRLGRRRVGDQHRRVDVGVELGHPLGGGPIGAADHDPIGVQEVGDRRAFAEELGVGHDEHVGALQCPLDHERRADRNRRLVDHDGAGLQHGRDLARRLLDVRQVGTAVVALRRRHAQEHDVGLGGGRLGAEHEVEPSCGTGVADDLIEAVLDDRDPPAVEQLDLALVDVTADDVVSEVGETGTRGESDVAGADDAETDRWGARHPRDVIGEARIDLRDSVGRCRRACRRLWRVGRCHRAAARCGYVRRHVACDDPGAGRPGADRRVWRSTRTGCANGCGTRPSNETLAKVSDWLVGTPITVLFILLGAWILSHIARRYLGRIVTAAIAQHDTVAARQLERVGLGSSDRRPRPAPRGTRSQSISGVVGGTAAVIIWVIALITVLGEIGIDLGPLIAGAGIAGIALGFGAQSIVKDFLAGLFVLIEDQYGIGDVVDLGEASGTVQEISLRATVLRAQDGTVWHVPNGEVVRVGNRSQLWSVAVVDVTVAYSSDLVEAQTVILRTAQRTVRVRRLEGPGARATGSARRRGLRDHRRDGAHRGQDGGRNTVGVAARAPRSDQGCARRRGHRDPRPATAVARLHPRVSE